MLFSLNDNVHQCYATCRCTACQTFEVQVFLFVFIRFYYEIFSRFTLLAFHVRSALTLQQCAHFSDGKWFEIFSAVLMLKLTRNGRIEKKILKWTFRSGHMVQHIHSSACTSQKHYSILKKQPFCILSLLSMFCNARALFSHFITNS